MNERIRELAEQVYGSAHYDDFKFAELIVAECVKLCEHKSNDDEYDQYDMGSQSRQKTSKHQLNNTLELKNEL